MSLRNLIAAHADEVFRGNLGREYNAEGTRLRPGGYERAIEKTLGELHNLSRYDPRIFTEQVAPQVRESLNAARRLNAGLDAPARFVPWQPGQTPSDGWGYQYVVRGRVAGRDGTGRGDFLTVVSSDRALTQSQIEGRAHALAQQGRVTQDYTGRVGGIESSTLVEYSTISAYRVQEL